MRSLLACFEARCRDDAGPMVELGALDLPQVLGRRPGRPKTCRLNPRPNLRIVRYRQDLLLEAFDGLCGRPRRNVEPVPPGRVDIGTAFLECRNACQERRALRAPGRKNP